MNKHNNQRYIYLDILRVIAISAVLLIHITANMFYLWSSINQYHWWIANIIDSFSRFGVPIFLMVSGTLLLQRDKLDEDIPKFYIKRLKRVFIPLIVWSLIYFLWKQRNSLALIDVNIIIENLKIILQGGIYYHLNFLYYLSALYLVTPILRVYLKSAKQKDLNYFLILWFVGNAVYPVITRFFNIKIGIPIYLVTAFIGYYILGYYIHNFVIGIKLKKAIYCLGFLSLLIIPLGTYFLTKASNFPDEWFYSYLNFAVIFVSISIMTFFKNVSWNKILKKKPPIESLINKISETSFGIYLLHPIILEILALRGIDSMYIHPLIGILISFILISIISFSIIYIIQKIPFLKRIV